MGSLTSARPMSGKSRRWASPARCIRDVLGAFVTSSAGRLRAPTRPAQGGDVQVGMVPSASLSRASSVAQPGARRSLSTAVTDQVVPPLSRGVIPGDAVSCSQPHPGPRRGRRRCLSRGRGLHVAGRRTRGPRPGRSVWRRRRPWHTWVVPATGSAAHMRCPLDRPDDAQTG